MRVKWCSTCKRIRFFIRSGEGWGNAADGDDIPFIRHEHDTEESPCAFCVRDLKNAAKWKGYTDEEVKHE